MGVGAGADCAAGLFKGAPTAISQRCPGCPCAGLSAVLVDAGAGAGLTVPFAGIGCDWAGTVVVPEAGTSGVAFSSLLPQAVNKLIASIIVAYFRQVIFFFLN